MNTLKRKFSKFLNDENGMEFIQLAVIVAGAILIAGAAVGIYQAVKGQMESSTNGLDSILNFNGSGGSSAGGSSAGGSGN